MTEAINSKFQSLVAMENLQNRSSSNLKSFQSLRNLNETNEVDQLSDVADQFEAIFIQMLLKQARESKLSDELFETTADDNFLQMYHEELAKSSSKKVDIGIAEAIISQMSGSGQER